MKSVIKKISAGYMTLLMLFTFMTAFTLSVSAAGQAAALNESIDNSGIDTIGAGSPTDGVSQNAADKKKSGVDPLVIIIVIAGAVALISAAGIVAYVVLKRKRDEHGNLVDPAEIEGANAAVQTPQPLNYGVTTAPTASRGAARSSSAQHNGKVFFITEKPVVIGRDPAVCAITYAPGTPGVSGKHCTLSYSSLLEQFTLTDIGSSYGTFLGDGARLQPNVPVKLSAGDCFFVGDKGNVITLDVEK